MNNHGYLLAQSQLSNVEKAKLNLLAVIDYLNCNTEAFAVELSLSSVLFSQPEHHDQDADII